NRRVRPLVLAVASLLAAACAAPLIAPGTSAPSNTSPASTTATATATPTPTPRAGPAIIDRVDVLARGLEAPWAIDLAPDGRLFVTERPGRVRVIKDGVLDPTPWATIAVRAAPDQESGLLGLAVDPDFATNSYVYVYYTYTGTGGRRQNRLERMRDVNGRGERDKVLLEGIAGADIHDGGRVKFGPDGKLYLTVGEAGNEALAQNVSSPNGKILRLERDGSRPSDDPFPNSFAWSYGHRHPQGLAWDASGRLYATEHGPSGNPALLQ